MQFGEYIIRDVYPEDIMSENNSSRSIVIIVKENNLSIRDNAIALDEKIKKEAGNIVKAYDNITKKNNGASDEQRQKELAYRIKKLRGPNIKTIYGVGLPLPNELTDSQSHNWSSSEDAIAGLASTIGMGTNGVANKIAGELASASGVRKPLIDPGYFQDYAGSDPREFTFNWEFVPANANEVNSVMNILYNLKKYTLPTSIAGGIGLLSPFVFDITLPNQRLNNIINMNDVVCKNIEINYSADGSLQFLPDGMPKYLRLSMTFAETSIVSTEFM